MAEIIAYLDCSDGINETLLFGALLDLGFPLNLLEQAVVEIPLLQGYQLQNVTRFEHGVRGSCFSMHAASQNTDLTITDIQALLITSSLPSHIQQRVMKVCNCLVSVLTQTDVEIDHYVVGSIDGMIALIGIVLALDFLSIAQIYASPLPLTQGFIQASQGLHPTVLPITLEILRRAGAMWKPAVREVELVTPLGAALLATFARFESPALRIEHVGYGFEQRDDSLPESKARSNGLRLCIGQSIEQEAGIVPYEWLDVATALAQGAEIDWVMVIESHIDNMNGELLGGFMERLFSAGALDVSYTPIQMKKNRPATLLTILCAPEIGEQLALLVLQETTTLGVRVQRVQRLKAQRYQETISTALGPIVVKVKRLGARIIGATPEYEECQRIALEQKLPLQDVYEVARVAIQNTILEK